VFRNYVHLRSGWEWEIPHHAEAFQPHSIFRNFETGLRWLAEGHIQVDGFYELVDPHHAAQVYQALSKRETEKLFMVFDWDKVRKK